MTQSFRFIERVGRPLYGLLASGWALFLAYGSLVPFNFERLPAGRALELFLRSMSFPLRIDSRTDFVTNILLGVPLAYLLMGALCTDRVGVIRRTVGLVATLALSLALSTSVEFLQIFTAARSPSLSDVIAQAVGALAGACGWLLLGDAVTRWSRDTLSEREQPAFVERALLAYWVLFTISQLMPLDLTISLGELAGKYRAGGVRVVPFTYQYESWFDLIWDYSADLLLCVPIGAGAALVGSAGRRRSTLRAAALGIAAVGAIEFGQVFVHARVADTTDVITGSLGVMAGIAAAGVMSKQARFQPVEEVSSSPSLWRAVLVLLWCLFLAAYHWRPFDFTTDSTRVTLGMHQLFSVPFYSYYVGTEFHAFTEMARKALLSAPLGVLLQMAVPSRRRMPQMVRLVALAIIGMGVLLAIEVGQVFLPTRVPDLTDVLIGGLGVAAAVAITIRLSGRPATLE